MSTKKIKPSDKGAYLFDLPVKQQKFVENLLGEDNFNGAAAAKRAGYKNGAQMAYKMLNNPKIQKALGKAIKDRSKRAQISADNVLTELAKIGFANVKDIMNDDGTIKPLSEISETASAAISNLVITTGTTKDGSTVTRVEIDYYDKLDALGMLMTHLGMDDERLKSLSDTSTDASNNLLMNLVDAVENGSNIISEEEILLISEEDG